MNKKGFIFDLDGVIVDTAHFHYKAWKKTANEFRITSYNVCYTKLLRFIIKTGNGNVIVFIMQGSDHFG